MPQRMLCDKLFVIKLPEIITYISLQKTQNNEINAEKNLGKL